MYFTFKIIFDRLFSLLSLLFFGWIIIIAWIILSIHFKSNGFFTQIRIGKNGKKFKIIKLKTMKSIINNNSTITAKGDKRITKLGAFFRLTKIDELPQLINVLIGDMSFVGPRPDVPGFLDNVSEEFINVKRCMPGITGLASLIYRNEEFLLSKAENPAIYNELVLWPNKLKINLIYCEKINFFLDFKIIIATLFPFYKLNFKKILGFLPEK